MADPSERLASALSDRYAIERELGQGGMATVYLAEDLKHRRKVAVKVLRPDLAATLGPERFLREIEIAAGLTHPHIVPLYDSGEADGFLYYVLAYIDGESLRAKLSREGELPIADAVRILRDVVDALTEAHAQGVVHRDIKPDNVLITKKHAVVTDFGVAKAVSEATGRQDLTTAGVALGTPAYMAPEQVAADPSIDHRADIYAVGALAYEMLTGRPPFRDGTPQAVLAAHVTRPPEAVTNLRQSVPPGLAQLVMKCLEKSRADRWQSTAELLSQLEADATPSGGVSLTGTQLTASENHGVVARRSHPVRVAALFGLASAGVLAIIYWLVLFLGLPAWVFVGAVALLVIGLPIVLVTGHHERQRALARQTGAAAPTPAGVRRWFTWRRSLLGGAMAFAALGISVSAFATMRAMGVGPAGTLITSGALEERGLLVVAEFDDRTPDGDIAESVTEAFRIDLSQSPAVRIMDASAVLDALVRMNREPGTTVDAPLAREIAQREGAGAMLAGEVATLGTSFVISVRLLAAADGAELLALRDRARDATDLVDAVDRLSARLRERIGESLKTIRADEPLELVTTPSLEALRLFTQHHRVEQSGDWERAVALLEEALTHDTTFAMAYRRMAVLLNNRGREPSRIVAAATRAFELRDRLPAVERYLAEAEYHSSVVPDANRGIDAYRSVLDLDPENRTATNNLALWLIATRRPAEAEDLFRRAIERGAIWQNYNGLISALAAQSKWRQAESTLVEFDRWSPSHPMMLRNGVYLASAHRDYVRADSLAAEFLAVGGGAVGPLLQAELYEIRGRLEDAEGVAARELADALREGDGLNVLQWAVWPIRHHVRYRDDPEAAVRELETVLERYPLDMAAPSDRPYAAMADIYGAAGRADEVRRLRAEWQASSSQRPDRVHEWEGRVALAEGRFADAVAAYRAADDEFDISAYHIFDLARAYDLNQQPDSALAVYERALDYPSKSRVRVEFDRLGPTYLRLGELYEAQGDRVKAAQYYNEFIDLWQDADAELQPLVADVRQRLARLVTER